MKKHLFVGILVALASHGISAQSFTNTTKVQGVGERQAITAIAIDDDNNKFVGTEQGLIKISSNGVVETVMSNVSVQALSWSKREGLWAAVDSNVLVHTNTGQTIILEGDKLHIQSMDFSGAQLWVGTNEGLQVVSVRRQKITDQYTPANSKMLSANVRYVYVDGSMIKWIGTDQGVLRVVNNKWKLYEKEEQINAITSNSEGVWIASDQEMWLVDSYNRWYPTGVDQGLSNGAVRALAADKKGKIYILSDVLVQFDPYSDETTEIEYDYAPEEAAHVAILCDLDDNLWMGSLESGLVTLNLEPSEETPFEVFVTVKHPKCAGDFNGAITINASGGSPPYAFDWSTDAIQGRSPNNLSHGKYQLTVTDATGAEYSHDISLEDPQPLTASIAQTQKISEQGASDAVLLVDGTGGTGDYTYTWSNGASNRRLSNVAAGTYTVEITDREGCTTSARFILEDGPVITPPEPETPEVVDEPLEAVDVEVLQSLEAEDLALGQTLRIEQLYFDADSTVVKSESHAVLDEIYEFLSNNQRITIEIGGHTNGLPEHDYCDRLSQARAKNVAEYLYGRGIPTDRIDYKGYGKRQPIATNETVIGRRKNQRVEIKILEI